MKKAFFYLVLALLVVSPIVLAEAYLRYVGLGEPIIYRENSAYRYAPGPDQRSTRLRGANVSLDSKGLRGEGDWTDPADVRVLFLGDSVTWGGTYIDDTETFAALTCRHLNAKGGRSFYCANGGVNAYGIDNVTKRLTYDPVVQEADVLVVTVITDDTLRGLVDVRGLYYYTREPWGPLKGLWETSGFALYALAQRMTHDRSIRTADFDTAVATAALDGLFATLRRLEADGKRVLVIYSPARYELAGDERPLTRLTRAMVAASGLPHLDFTALAAASVAGDFYYSDDNMHLERGGHQLYGRAIAAWLEESLTVAR